MLIINQYVTVFRPTDLICYLFRLFLRITTAAAPPAAAIIAATTAISPALLPESSLLPTDEASAPSVPEAFGTGSLLSEFLDDSKPDAALPLSAAELSLLFELSADDGLSADFDSAAELSLPPELLSAAPLLTDAVSAGLLLLSF